MKKVLVGVLVLIAIAVGSFIALRRGDDLAYMEGYEDDGEDL